VALRESRRGAHSLLSRLRRLGPPIRGFLRVMRANPLTLVGFLLVVIIAVLAILVVLVPLVSQPILGRPLSILPYDPNYFPSPCPTRIVTTGNFSYTTCALPPSLNHLLGTDNVGRDMLSRVLSALPLDLAIGFSVTGFAALLGGALGLIAGYWDRPRTVGGVVSVTILRITDIFLAFPSLVLALAIAATLGRGTLPSVLAILLTWWPYYVRLVRGEVLVVKTQPYVTAAKAAGVSDVRILLRHVIRNILEPLIVYYTLDVGTVLVTFSTISFIGIGVPLDVPEWGNMVEYYQSQNLLGIAPWTILAAGGAIFLTVLAFSLLGDGLRDVLDPRSRRALVQAAVPTKLAASPGALEA
jgi:peptide/nickel transport system permease protein